MLFLLLFMPSLACGQSTYILPQTVDATLATNQACNGSAQTYVTQPNSQSGFVNLGQTQHYASVSITNAQKFQMEIDGIDTAGNVYRISDILEFAGIAVLRQGTLTGTGRFSRIQVMVTCSPNTATYTLTYNGTSATSNVNSGTFLSAQIDKVNFNNAPGNVDQSDTFQTPFGNTSGTLFFQYVGSSVAGSTLSVGCLTLGPSGSSGSPLVVANLANTTALQTFRVPAATCPQVQVGYGHGGSAQGVSLEYVFDVPGLAGGTNPQFAITGIDPCSNPNIAKNSVPINITSASTTTLIGPFSTGQTYVCGWSISLIGASQTIQFEYGSGASCGTGTVLLTGAMGPGTLAEQQLVHELPLRATPLNNSICAVTTGATVNAQGVMTYVQ